MDQSKIKSAVRKVLEERGIQYSKVQCRSISFQDLARDTATCVIVKGLTLPDTRLQGFHEAVETASGRKVIMEFRP